MSHVKQMMRSGSLGPCRKPKGLSTLNPSFDTWKFWLSSAAIFAGILVAGLIPGCS